MRRGDHTSAMRYVYMIVIAFFISLILFGCGIEGKIDNASVRCEEKISELLEGIEEVCLTKEEILELISSTDMSKDTEVFDEISCERDELKYHN